MEKSTRREPSLAYTSERLRAGIPALQLQPLSPTAPALGKFPEFLPRIERILRDREVEYEEDEEGLVHGSIPNEDVSEDDLTVFIFARWRDEDDGQKWFLAAEDIRAVLLYQRNPHSDLQPFNHI